MNINLEKIALMKINMGEGAGEVGYTNFFQNIVGGLLQVA